MSSSTRELTVLENDEAQELRGHTIENWPFLLIIQNCFTEPTVESIVQVGHIRPTAI